jgi:flagellar basal-body rod protein FlgC
MFQSLDISASGLVAQRTRLDAISSNIANLTTIRDENGDNKPYQPRFTIFQTDESMTTATGAVGVKVASVETETVEPLLRYQPHHPLANGDGYVAYPNINLNREFTDALEAARAYEANVGVIETTKVMARDTLRIIA